MNKTMEENRLGEFRFARKFLQNEEAESMFFLFSNFIMMNAEYIEDLDAIQYLGYCKLFNEVEKGGKVPFYQIGINDEEDPPKIIAIKIKE